jgi:hypothetical protein
MTLDWWQGENLQIPFEEWKKHRHYRPDKWKKKLQYVLIIPFIRDLDQDLKELRIIQEAYMHGLLDVFKDMAEKAVDNVTKQNI